MKSSSVSECGYSSFFKDYPSDCKYRCLCHLQSDAKSGYVCPRCHPEFTPPQSGKRLTTTRQLKKKGLQDSGKEIVIDKLQNHYNYALKEFGWDEPEYGWTHEKSVLKTLIKKLLKEDK